MFCTGSLRDECKIPRPCGLDIIDGHLLLRRRIKDVVAASSIPSLNLPNTQTLIRPLYPCSLIPLRAANEYKFSEAILQY